MLKLFHAWGSCSLASLITLEEAGADYELVTMSTKAGDQRTSEYLAVNPKGRVPALVTERGVLTETPAILAFVAQTFPAAKLAPLGDPFAFARAQAFNSYLCSTVHVAHAHRHRGYRWADDPAALAEMTRKVPEVEAACFQLIEDDMLAGPWVLGEAYSICDPYLFTLAGWLEGDGIDIARFPKVLAHSERMRSRQAVRKVLAEMAV
ncbi:glutathione S-transferase family protein [Phenylobacterium sp.]|jgi:glutathione S-transferase|uniref:glutathione S-transferase family protein n=1 Tax=Phenylobacterium sp. TaxID=1871053 RepID=UPI002F4138F0